MKTKRLKLVFEKLKIKFFFYELKLDNGTGLREKVY